MKLIFTDGFDQLKGRLSSIDGEWDESQKNKKVLRYQGGIINWYETTGTLQFQGQAKGKAALETLVREILSPEELTKYCDVPQETVLDAAKQDNVGDIACNESLSSKYLTGRFDSSEIIIGVVSAVGTETTRVITPLKDRLKQLGYITEEIKVSSLLKKSIAASEYDRIKELISAGDQLREKSKNNGNYSPHIS